MKSIRPILAIAAIALLAACNPNYSNGSRNGVVTKLSLKGSIFKSWEGEMLVALPASVASSAQPEKFEFNVDPAAVSKVQAAMDSGKRVSLIYRQWQMAPSSIDNDHVVIDVKTLE